MKREAIFCVAIYQTVLNTWSQWKTYFKRNMQIRKSAIKLVLIVWRKHWTFWKAGSRGKYYTIPTSSVAPFSKPEIVTCRYGNDANLIGALSFLLESRHWILLCRLPEQTEVFCCQKNRIVWGMSTDFGEEIMKKVSWLLYASAGISPYISLFPESVVRD